MNMLANYIENGTGRGLKRFFIFSFVLSVLFGILMNTVIYGTAEEKVQEFFKQVPQVELKDGKIVAPANAFVVIPFLDGDEGGFVLDTTGNEPKMVFKNGMYVTTDKAYVQNGVQMSVVSLGDIPNSVLTQKDVSSFMQRSIGMISSLLGLTIFIVLWIGYALLYLAVKLFFLIIGRTTCPYVRGRSVFVAWMSILVLDMLLLVFGYGYSLPLAFVLALLLAILIVFKTPLHSMDMEETLETVSKMPATLDVKKAVVAAPKATAKKAVAKLVKKTVAKPVSKPVIKTKTPAKKAVAKAKTPAKKAVKK